MKKKTVGILLRFMVSAMLLNGCGKPEATETANDELQIVDEKDAAVEEKTEETIGTEDDTEVSDDSEKAPEDSKDDQTEDSDAADTENEEAVSEETEEEREKITVFLPDEADEMWKADGEYITAAFDELGYEAVIQYAEGNSSLQTEQIKNILEEETDAFVVAPVDSYGFTELMPEVKEAGIQVFNYEDLIMDTYGIKYYVTFGGREIGQMIGNAIIEKEDLEQARKDAAPKTIEFFMGSTDDTEALFVYNGIMEVLQEYLDDGTLVCKSGNVSFEDTGLLRWDSEAAKDGLQAILGEFYQDTDAPDIICTGFDAAAISVQEVLEDAGLVPASEEWPMITGIGCEAEVVKDIAEGRMSFSIFKDRRIMAKKCAELVDLYLNDKESEEIDYEQYDNGMKIVGTCICEGQLIDRDNYELLIDNGYYTEEQVRPEMTPTPVPTETPTPIPTEEPEETPVPVPTEEPEETPAPATTEESEEAEELQEPEEEEKGAENVSPTPTEKAK